MIDRYDRMQEEIIKALQESYLQDILITNPMFLDGKSEDEIKRMVNDHLYKLIKTPNLEFLFIVDHTDSLLKSARSSLKNGQNELAALFYATYFEHKINYFIHLAGKKKRISEYGMKKIYRKLDLQDKSTWVLEIMGIQSIALKHQKIMKSIGDIRSRYIHFKWHPENEDLEKKEEKELLKAEETVRYLRRFEEMNIFKGARSKIFKAIKSFS